MKLFLEKLGFIGLPSEGVGFWRNVCENSQSAMFEFESNTFLSRPSEWFNPNICFYTDRLDVQSETKHLILAMVLIRLLTDPANVKTWREMKSHISSIQKQFEIEPIFGKQKPINKRFVSLLEHHGKYSMENWCLEYYYGLVWRAFGHAILKLKNAKEEILERTDSYQDLFRRLHQPVDWSQVKYNGKFGSNLIVTHNRFQIEMYKKTFDRFRNDILVITKKAAQTASSRNIQPILMYKALQKNKLVYIAADARAGTLSSTINVFGNSLECASSFSWAAWKSGSASQFAYIAVNENSSGLNIVATDLYKEENNKEVGPEKFKEKYLRDIGYCIENATLNHPFSYGLIRGSNAALLTE